MKNPLAITRILYITYIRTDHAIAYVWLIMYMNVLNQYVFDFTREMTIAEGIHVLRVSI